MLYQGDKLSIRYCRYYFVFRTMKRDGGNKVIFSQILLFSGRKLSQQGGK
ncbi:hypothetical protein ymoll0001_28770 [Yersinia mollaretii ATCC 43969]|uniref:Uncharacterized protein n=1 Tax=Yersinia mollaretii (strain ATCC 43969 / DSM 18520 / CIP 103324 / CNY 7263 / WAIP 204) TaxID=349967 RepID=A0ABP2EJN2_YERMW|nr:hypothetical protein ymoll0001_28770 [Yersinia mollaretii ATCC 43969]